VLHLTPIKLPLFPINTFLYEGPLSSPRVAAIDEPITQLMTAAWERGVRDILLVQDAHQEDSLEFDVFGSHALKGSHGAETVDQGYNFSSLE